MHIKRKKLLIFILTAMGTAGVFLSSISPNSISSNLISRINAEERNNLVLSSANSPSFLVGSTSSSLVNGTSSFVNNTLPITYTKVFKATSGHVSLGIGGSISSSTNSSQNFSNLSTIKVTFSTGNVWIRYGFKGEDHQLFAESGVIYSINANWFQIRNTDAAIVENLNVFVTYPCSDDAIQPENKYFSEGFNNGIYDGKNISFDCLADSKQLVSSYLDSSSINVSMFSLNSHRYNSFINTVSKFNGEYSVSIRLKAADADSKRFIIILGKTNYKTGYSNIVGDAVTGHPESGCSFEFNLDSKWVRATGGNPSSENPLSVKQLSLTCLTLDATKDYVTYTLKVSPSSSSVFLYENDVLVGTFDNSLTYVTDGYISFQAGSSGSANFSIAGFGVDGLASNNFDATFDHGTIGPNLIYYKRTASEYTIDDTCLSAPFVNGNLSTVTKLDNVDITVKYKNSTDGRLTLLFGATNPAGKGYRPAGTNIANGIVGVLITPTFVRVYNQSSAEHASANENFGSVSTFITCRIVFNEGNLRVYNDTKLVLKTTVYDVDSGYVTMCAGNNPATVLFDYIQVSGNTSAGLIDSPQAISIPANSSREIVINKTLGSMNYLSLKTQCSSYYKGEFVYHSVDDSSKVVNEEFFVEASENESTFNQFLDAFRTTNNTATGEPMSVGIFNKVLDKIVLKNVTSSQIVVNVNYLDAKDRVVPSNEKMVYAEKDGLKVGMDLATGGSLSYLEKTAYNGGVIQEVLENTSSYFVKKVSIGPNKGTSSYKTLSSNVNLINIYDVGRQIQQSYYASVGGSGGTELERRTSSGNENGYTRKMSYTADSNGYYWPYNPVQAGDEINNVSQIIDYQVNDDELYCKVRALDWAAGTKDADRTGNRVTKSYIENWFKIVNGVLQVKNKFTDWNGFTNMSSIPSHNLELPATYISHPLHNFYAYVGDNPFNETEMASGANLDIQGELGSWASGSYKTTKHLENWFAWLNDDADPFGVAMYIPGTSYYASGRSSSSTLSNESKNTNAYNSPLVKNLLYNKIAPTSKYTSCYTSNTSYTAPTLNVKMKEYIPLEYEYVLAVDTLSSFRSLFKTYYENNMFANNGLKNWN